MQRAQYESYLSQVTEWALGQPEVIGLVAGGSTAQRERQPDEWSDHDLLVVTEESAAAGLRGDVSWLPNSAQIVMVCAETLHGRGVVYADGHLVELAVFANSELDGLPLNCCTTLVDKGGIKRRVTDLISATNSKLARESDGGERHFQMLIKELQIGLSRYGRGEYLSANHRIRGDSITHLLALLQVVVLSSDARADNLDPHRRVEQTMPEVAERLRAALTCEIPELALRLLDIVEQYVAAAVEYPTEQGIAAIRVLSGALTSKEPRRH